MSSYSMQISWSKAQSQLELSLAQLSPSLLSSIAQYWLTLPQVFSNIVNNIAKYYSGLKLLNELHLDIDTNCLILPNIYQYYYIDIIYVCCSTNINCCCQKVPIFVYLFIIVSANVVSYVQILSSFNQNGKIFSNVNQ